MRVSRVAPTFLLVVLASTGCVPAPPGPMHMPPGPAQTTPHHAHGAGGLVPSEKDKDAGLVGIAPGFDVRRYSVVAVDQCSVAASEIKDEEDRNLARTMPAFFQAETARRLKATGVFARVVSLGKAPLPSGPDRALRIECTMWRLAPGSLAGRFFLPGGVGRTKAEVEIRFVDVQTDTVVMVTADRRAGQRPRNPEYGLESEGLLRDSFEAMARDLAKFLVRLSRGEAPRK